MANQYFTCVLDAWRDGKTLYGRMHYYRSGTYTYTDSSFPTPTMNLGGTVYYDNDFANRVHSGIAVGDVYSTTFSRTVGGTGDRTVTWSAGSGSRSDFAGTWSKTVNFPVETSPPTGLTLTSCSAGPDWYDIGVSVSGWGTGGSASQRYIEAQVWTYNASSLVEPRRYQPSYGTTSATIRVNNSSSGSLSITPNTVYTIGVYASNGAANTGSQRIGNHVTAPPILSASASNITKNSMDINWSFGNQGGHHSLMVQYSLDGTNWTTMSTQTGSGSRSGVYTITGLTPETEYTVRTRVTRAETGQAYYATTGETVSATTLPAGTIYGPVNGVSKKTIKWLGSVDGLSKYIVKIYGSEDGKTKRIF